MTLDRVAGPQLEGAGWNIYFSAALYAADQGLCAAGKRGQIAQIPAAQRVVLREQEFDDLHPALGKRLAFQRGRKTEQVQNLHRGGTVGIDNHAEPKLLFQKSEQVGVFRIAHARDGVLYAQFAAEHTAQDIDLVGGRRRDQQIGFPHARIPLRLQGRSVADHGAYVRPIDQFVQHFRIAVDHNNIVVLFGKLGSQRRADLPISHDYDTHFAHLLYIIISQSNLILALSFPKDKGLEHKITSILLLLYAFY